MASRPASFRKVDSCSWPTTEGVAEPDWVTWTCPVGETDTSVASPGMVIEGCTW